MQPRTVTTSSPGKILITGGYTILESENRGIVIEAGACRFFSTVVAIDSSVLIDSYFEKGDVKDKVKVDNIFEVDDDAINDNNTILTNLYESIPCRQPLNTKYILVVSPQLRCGWLYALQVKDGNVVVKMIRGKENKFIETSILLSYTHIHSVEPLTFGVDSSSNVILIRLKASNYFYSQKPYLLSLNLSYTSTNLFKVSEFNPLSHIDSTVKQPLITQPCNEEMSELDKLKPIGYEVDMNKCGMGSSAALVVSLVSSLFLHVLPPISLDTNTDMEEIKSKTYVISQITHSHAQGSIGSGFDIACACVGSMIYERGGICLLKSEDVLGFVSTCTCTCDDSEWKFCDGNALTSYITKYAQDYKMNQLVEIPKSLSFVMGDTSSGSSSPSMAKEVFLALSNARNEGEGDILSVWKDLKIFNDGFVDLFLNLISNDGTRKEVNHKMIIETFAEIRANLKILGILADVPVEPDVQTALLERVADSNEGVVVVCGVPGAGGYDAVFAMTYSPLNKNDDDNDQKSGVGVDFGEDVCGLYVCRDGGGESGLRIENNSVRM